MQKNYSLILFSIVVLACHLNLQAQIQTTYKDVLLDGKPAKLNLETGEITLVGAYGNNSINNTQKNNEENSLNNLEYHVVKPGENLLKISNKYGLSIEDIKEANNLNTTLIRVGQKLHVKNLDSVKQNNSADVWVVLKGNTLYHISRKTGVSIETIKRLNGLKSNILSIGQKLYLK